jgi:hypothetical protein
VLAHVVKMMAEHAAESVDAQTEPAVTQ